MKKMVLFAAAGVLLAQFATTSVALADYVPSQDTTINLTAPVDTTLPLNTATTTFNLQQGVQQTVTSTTGVSVNYDYVWVDVNGQPVLAVDPPMPMF